MKTNHLYQFQQIILIHYNKQFKKKKKDNTTYKLNLKSIKSKLNELKNMLILFFYSKFLHIFLLYV